MIRIFITILLALMAGSAWCQNSIVGEVSTDYNRNSIIRNCNGSLVAYGEKLSGGGSLMLVGSPAANHTVPSIMLPQHVHIKDFTYYDSVIYFVGYQLILQDSMAIVGKVPMSDFGQAWANLTYSQLNPSYLFLQNGSLTNTHKCLWHLVAYPILGKVHVVAVGENHEQASISGRISGNHKYGVYDVVIGQPQYKFAVSNEMLFDLDIVDDYVVVAGRKGLLSDLSRPGYLVAWVMDKDADPVQSLMGRLGFNSDGYVYATGNVRIVRTEQSQFALAYMVDDNGSEYFELSHWSLDPMGYIHPICSQRCSYPYNTRPYYLCRDMLYNSASQSICALSECDRHAGYTVFKADSHGDCLDIVSEFSHSRIKQQSLCGYANTSWAGCGTTSSNLLHVMVQEINGDESCGQIYPAASIGSIKGHSTWVDLPPQEAGQSTMQVGVPVIQVPYQTTCVK